MAEDLTANFLDVIQRATLVNREEPPPVDAQILCIGCNNPATRVDGKCAACATNRRLTKDIKADAADRLARRQLEYVDIHLAGAKIAAAKGDTKSAEWAMERTGVVAPPERSGGGAQVVVQIGMILPGLPGAE